MKYIGINFCAHRAEEAVISVRDHGFLYGMGLFETFRTYGGRPFLLNKHLDRLRRGCAGLGIPWEAEEQRLLRWIALLMDKNGLQEAYIRYTVTAGEEALGLPSGDYGEPCQVLYVKPLPTLPESLYKEGKSLQLLHHRRNTPEGEVRLKSLHYMNNILAKRELSVYPSAAQGAEGLMLTREGRIAEGIVSNIFWIRNGALYTPAVSAGILPGITREMVLELAREDGMAVEEGLYEPEALYAADEAFLTNSIQELVPVNRLWNTDGQSRMIGTGTAGTITQRLLQLYRERVKRAHETDAL